MYVRGAGGGGGGGGASGFTGGGWGGEGKAPATVGSIVGGFIPSSAAPLTDSRMPVNYTSVPSSAAPLTDSRMPVNVSAPPISATVGVMPSNVAPITDNRPAPTPVVVAHPLIIRQPVVSTPLKPTGRGTNIAF